MAVAALIFENVQIVKQDQVLGSPLKRDVDFCRNICHGHLFPGLCQELDDFQTIEIGKRFIYLRPAFHMSIIPQIRRIVQFARMVQPMFLRLKPG